MKSWPREGVLKFQKSLHVYGDDGFSDPVLLCWAHGRGWTDGTGQLADVSRVRVVGGMLVTLCVVLCGL